MRAAIVRSAILRNNGTPIPHFPLPATADEAYALRARNLAQALPSLTDRGIDSSLMSDIEDVSQAINDLLLDTDDTDSEGSIAPAQDDLQDPFSEEPDLDEQTQHWDSTRAGEGIHGSSHSNSEASVMHSALDFDSVPSSSSQQSLNEQTLSRVLYELEHTAPKLDQLGTWLEGVHLALGSTQEVRRMERLKASFHSLISQFDRLAIEAGTSVMDVPEFPALPAVPALRTSTPPAQPTKRSKRRADDIIGPSPEKRASKRHDSHAPH
ncbi:hypothetical protein NM688_g8654 [Phlebia brevispora]|uniref:Uncharacterized protein n=1 Tax=Phlebia brevispora TaxID=194682 RepID=A0ACC1RRZ8_9APHY|nr:hypothetical protein NM688_g8654 [Phlebia brevispora]